MTKSRPFATKLRLSRICRLVMLLAAVKIAFLAGLALTGSAPDQAAADMAFVASQDATQASVQESAGLPAAAPESVPLPTVTERPALPVAPPLTAAADSVALQTAARPGAKSDHAPSPSAAVETAPVPPRTAAQADGDALQNALAQASSRSALSVPRLLGASVAQAADLPPVPEVAAPAPKVRPMPSPVAPERLVRPDEVTPPAPPAPTVGPYVSPDSAARKQAEINRREQELLALQQQMEARMSELHGLENRLQGMLQDANSAQDSKFKQLVDMYANMKPRQAAQALTTMDENIAVKILTGMKSKQSGEILSYMDPTHAARLSEVMSKMQM